MTDLINEIAAGFAGYDPEYDEPNEAAQATIDLIIARIPPLVWERVGDRNLWICQNTLSGKDAFIKVYAGTDVFNLYADGFRGCGHNYPTLEAAQAAANARNVAQLCKGMGIE